MEINTVGGGKNGTVTSKTVTDSKGNKKTTWEHKDSNGNIVKVGTGTVCLKEDGTTTQENVLSSGVGSAGSHSICVGGTAAIGSNAMWFPDIKAYLEYLKTKK
jgi:hypothetical protein